jgi:hypothetical protein
MPFCDRGWFFSLLEKFYLLWFLMLRLESCEVELLMMGDLSLVHSLPIASQPKPDGWQNIAMKMCLRFYIVFIIKADVGYMIYYATNIANLGRPPML